MNNRKIQNRYSLRGNLGAGAMGEVYLAYDERTGQEVAIKVLPAALTSNDRYIQRFEREAQVLRDLNHPNIVNFVDHFIEDSNYYLVMAYIPGGSLSQRLHDGALQVDKARQIMIDLTDALIRAHSLGIIHRDIKPSNILFSFDDRPILTDFGVARDEKSESMRLTGTGVQLGTADYMSPEAWHGDEQDHRTDIWSLGVVFFEMLTGQRPFQGDKSIVVMRHILQSPTPSITSLNTDVPPGLVAIVEKMLAKDRDLRYQSMREVSADLATGAPAEPLRQSNTRTLPVGALNRRSGLVTVTVFGLLVVALIVAFIFLNMGGDDSSVTNSLSVVDQTATAVAGFTDTPTPPPTNTATATNTPSIPEISSPTRLTVYAAPHESAEVIGELPPGQVKQVISRSADGDWYQVLHRGQIGWVLADEVAFAGNPNVVDIAQEASSTPTPTQTFTPTDTPTDTATATSTPTDTPTHTPTHTAMPTDTPTPSDTPTVTLTPSFTLQPSRTPLPTDTPTPTPLPIIENVSTQGAVSLYEQPDTRSVRLLSTTDRFEPYLGGRNDDGSWLYVYYFDLGELSAGWAERASFDIDDAAIDMLGLVDPENPPNLPDISFDAAAAPPSLIASATPPPSVTRRSIDFNLNFCQLYGTSESVAHVGQSVWVFWGMGRWTTPEETQTYIDARTMSLSINGNPLGPLSYSGPEWHETGYGYSTGITWRPTAPGTYNIVATNSAGPTNACTLEVRE